MGRSVETVSDATAVAYSTFEPQPFECWACEGEGTEPRSEGGVTCEECNGKGTIENLDEDGSEWRDYLEWIEERAFELWPSMTADEHFLPNPWRETIVVASNAHSEIAVAEYAGRVAISLIPKYDRDTYFRTDDPLGERWRRQVSEKFLSEFGEYEKVGTMSNGESLYRSKENHS